jgi:hypothetical protein
MERFNLKQLNELESKEQFRGAILTGSQNWKTKTLRWILIETWKLYKTA